MISFHTPSESEYSHLCQSACGMPLLLSLTEMAKEGENELTVATTKNAVFVRFFDGNEYSFLMPFPSYPFISSIRYLSEIEEYAKRQEIPLALIGIQRSLLSRLVYRYRHTDVDALDDKNRIFMIHVKTELMLLDSLPTIETESVTLSPLSDGDIVPYAELCLNTDRLFGYDYREDNPDADGRYFLDAAEADFRHRSALTLAVREKGGTFVGEATLHAFSGKGDAEFSVRILPAYRRKGYAAAALRALTDYAFDSLGLTRVYARCKPDNLPSRAFLTNAIGDYAVDTDGNLRFTVV